MIARSLAAIVGGVILVTSGAPAEPETWRVPDYPAPITRQPVTSIGTNATPSPVASRASRSRSTGITLDVTAYVCTGNRTASGVMPQVGMAATLARIPFGTRIFVPGVGVVTVTDRIGHSSDLDLYMGCGAQAQQRAEQWGRQRLTVEVLG
jgi:3D (Asp-Asp-Asp) domain-containing protein